MRVDVDVRSWVRADRAELDGPLSAILSSWLAAAWPFGRSNLGVPDHPSRLVAPAVPRRLPASAVLIGDLNEVVAAVVHETSGRTVYTWMPHASTT